MVYPSRLRAALIVFSLRGLAVDLMLGNRYLSFPVKGCKSERTFNDCSDKGTICTDRCFIFCAGMRHSLFIKSISDHSACLSSPGLTNIKGASCKAQRVVNSPSYPSIALSNSPIFLGSVMLAWCLADIGGRAPIRNAEISCFARPVAIAYLNICPQF